MSQASPVKEQAGLGDSGSKASFGSRPKPPRYPSFSFRRALSGAQSRTKGEETLPTMSESDCPEPKNGKLIHVRVTLGYLKAIERIEKGGKRKHVDTSLVTAFASLAPQDSSSQHGNYAPSMPLSGASIVNNVVWPKQKERGEDGADKSNRRLYFSTILQRDEDDDNLRNLLAREDDLSTVTGTSAWDKHEVETFEPKLIKIQLGVARGMDLLHLGVATLVVDGTDVSGKQMDLPVRALLPGEDDTCGYADKSSSPRRRGLKRLFGKKSKAAKTSFEADAYEYRLSPNAILRIRVDVISDSTPLAKVSLSGPAVWGDGVEDDNDSFASIVVMDIGGDDSSAQNAEGVEVPRDESQRGDASTAVVQIGTDTSESIEVVNNPMGPSIISPVPLAPLKFEEPNVTDIETQETSILPITSVDVEPQNTISPRAENHGENPSRTLTMFQTTGMLCGFTDAFNHPGIEADMSSLDFFEDSSTIATSHYNGTRAEAWKLAASGSQSTGTSGILRRTSLGSVDERSEENTSRPSRLSASRSSPASRTSALLPSSMSRKQLAGTISIGEDTMKSLDEAKKALQCYAERTGEDYHSMLQHLDAVSSSDILSLEPSIGEDTIDSVYEAKELLQRYAGKIGLDVQDLLEVDLSNLATFSSPSSALTHATSNDDTEGTNNTSKSSKSRFSLFVDD